MKFLDLVREKVLVLDGGMGTGIQFRQPEPEDWGGHEGMSEWLNLTRPDLIGDIHRSFLEIGCDAVETNSFGGFPVVLDEYGQGARAQELAVAAARIAREAADEASSSDRPRFVIGSIGPGTKLPSLGHISFRDLRDSYEPLVDGLVEGAVDALLVETCQDMLQLRAAVEAVRRVLARRRLELPMGVQITVESTGSMLLGTETHAALSAILPLRPHWIGMNCATGPEAMTDHVRTLCRHAPVPVSVLPNAGLPRNVDGEMVYDLSPELFADILTGFVDDFGVNIVGGCCGTEPHHLKALIDHLEGRSPAPREPVPLQALSSLYQSVDLDQEPRPLLIGERTNANGSKRFRELQGATDLDGMVALAREQQNEGAHLLDVCLAFVGRDEVADMAALMPRLNTEVQVPVMIDSTDPAAVEAALERLGGRCIVNSINLEDGEDRAREILELCRRFGAAVVALCIDEHGMALSPEKKLEIAERLVDLAAEYGLSPRDMLFDPLTFTLGSGDPEYHDSALATLEGLRLIKREIPGARTLLGLSNVSFGLKPKVRKILNSVFLRRALEAGLDAAILHAGKILGADEIPAELLDACKRLIDNDRSRGEPLEILLQSKGVASVSETAADLPPAERLHRRIVAGDRKGLEDDLDDALAEREPLEIINEILLGGMKEVGDLFGAGKLQLPFVLKSAETMKAAVRHLEPHMEKSTASSRGEFVVATVQGDVHDIGKNLVDIILTNNGFKVYNLGIKVPVDQIIEAVRRDAPDAVGMSGLLVKSTIVMKENLEAFNRAGLDLPVVLGGAALTRKYVEADLRRVYGGSVYYARNAFDGLQLLDRISAGDPPPAEPRDTGEDAQATAKLSAEPVRAIELPETIPAPTPPFWGTRVSENIDLEAVWPLLNRKALVKGRWGYKRAGLSDEEYEKLDREQIEPALATLRESSLVGGWLNPAAIHGWFACRRSGDAIEVFERPEDKNPCWRLSFPRQAKPPFRCLADWFREDRDLLGVMVVTMGREASRHCAKLMEEDSYQEYLHAHGFAVESAEALAELWHARLRAEIDIGSDDGADPAALIRGQYRGRRFSYGYPACPDLEQQAILAEMLDWSRIGIELTEGFQLVPEQSTSALVVHHPKAEYMSV